MSKVSLAKKFEVSGDLRAMEKIIALSVFKKRHKISKLKKLKEYATMHKCDFRDKQIKKLVGEQNG